MTIIEHWRNSRLPKKARWNGIDDPHDVRIEDARAHAADFTLDRNGFALIKAPTAVRDFYSEDEVKQGKQGLLQERKLSRSDDHRIAGELVHQDYLGRTWTRDGAVDAAIEKLTVADVNAVLRKYLKPEQLAFAFAGDFGKK